MRRLLLLVVLAALALTPAASAQPAGGLAVTAVDTTNHPEVVLRLSAPPELVGESLNPDVVSLTEGGRPRDVTVERLRGDELEVLLAIDTSFSMGSGMATTKDAAARVLDQLPEGTRVAVVGYAADAFVVSPLSADFGAHRAAIGDLAVSGPSSSTSLYDAITLSLEQFGDHSAQRAAVVLSDGGATTAGNLGEVIGAVQRSGATLHAVELTTSATDPNILNALAAAGNGRYISVNDFEALAEVYRAIGAELRDSYVLTYRSQVQGRVDVNVVVDHAGGPSTVTHRISMPSPPVVPFAPSVTASAWTLAVGAVLLFVALLLVLLTVLWPGEARSTLNRPRWSRGAGIQTAPGVASLANRATLVVEKKLTKRGWTPSLNATLEQAGVHLRPGEFVVLAACAAVIAFAAGVLLSGILLGLGLFAGAVTTSFLGVKFLGERRRAKFADQLGETLQLLAGTLRAGYSLLQAVDAVARESESPTAEEFRRLVVETRLGRDLEESMHAMDSRLGSEDFQWVVQAIAIHQDVGGDLAEVLDAVAGTIRERNQIRRQVKALSAEGKLSAVVLYALPFGVAGFILVSNPSYLSPLFSEPVGWLMLGIGAALLVAGGFWLRKVVRIVF